MRNSSIHSYPETKFSREPSSLISKSRSWFFWYILILTIAVLAGIFIWRYFDYKIAKVQMDFGSAYMVHKTSLL